jgi:hypothetical protein
VLSVLEVDPFPKVQKRLTMVPSGSLLERLLKEHFKSTQLMTDLATGAKFPGDTVTGLVTLWAAPSSSVVVKVTL